jgi:hypothetical protein
MIIRVMGIWLILVFFLPSGRREINAPTCHFVQIITSCHARRQLEDLVREALIALFPEEPANEPLVAACTTKFGDYQWYSYFWVWNFRQIPCYYNKWHGGLFSFQQQCNGYLVKDQRQTPRSQEFECSWTGMLLNQRCKHLTGMIIQHSSHTVQSWASTSQRIAKAMPMSPLIEKMTVAGPGFVNIVVSSAWIEEVSLCSFSMLG